LEHRWIKRDHAEFFACIVVDDGIALERQFHIPLVAHELKDDKLRCALKMAWLLVRLELECEQAKLEEREVP
jgi:hypothetical protein